MNQSEKRLFLIQSLLKENQEYRDMNIPEEPERQRQLLRGLMNIRAPKRIGADFLKMQDEYLQSETVAKGITDIADLTPIQQGLYIWQGDITTLKCDAIVNAANSGMTGCYIHTFAGVELRLACEEMMEQQGYPEPTGQAKITPAFNLPCRYVLHTVGPIINGRVTKEDEELLASCYRSCLELAAENSLESVAFCCISTGEFHFPNEQAAQIAVETAKQFINRKTSVKKVICSEQLERLQTALQECDAVVIGAGAGLSTAAGFIYTGERFEKYFSDFAAKYGIKDMYSGGFYPFATLEEHWAYWSRYIYINRYMDAPKPVYDDLLKLVADKDYFIITTNVDHCFQKAGFDKKRLFYTQGDYGLFQCSEPCCKETFDNEAVIREMVARQENMKIPTELLPVCPHCGKPMTMNLRCDDTFVEDEGWHRAAERYENFLRTREGQKILFLELGVGYNTPVIIKYPFWQMTAKNPGATYACINQGQAFCPQEIKKWSICMDADIGQVMQSLFENQGTL